MGYLEEKVKGLAEKLGFDAVGITSAEPFIEDEEASVARIGEGLLEGMAWITEDRMRRAARPEKALLGARSVISLAMSYYSGNFPNRGNGQPRGRVARYAWGDDYHVVIKRRLRSFGEGLAGLADRPVKWRGFVDDGPMLDRAVARRAGVGWFGKSTNILTAGHGSWVFLAEVVTDLDLRPDEPLKKTCGQCVRCMDACPTGAILAPYVIDARKCISYLTIECRGPMPRPLRPLVGDWVFGCDVCQDVCPVNFKAEQSREPAFSRGNGFSAPALIPLLSMTDEQFRQMFRNSPIKRAKRVGLQRNVCVALGNLRDPSAVPALATTLGEAEPLVRMHAAWALGRIGGSEAARILQKVLAVERDETVIQEIRLACNEVEGGAIRL